MTNYETKKRTKEEMQAVAQDGLERIKIAYEIVNKIAKGQDPEEAITGALEYAADFKGKINFNGLSEHVENTLELLWEYRTDLNTLNGEGITS